MKAFPVTSEPRTNLVPPPISPNRPSRARPPFRSLRQWRHFPLTAEVQTNFGRTGPTCPPSSGHNSLLPPAAIPAAPGKFNAPFPTRRTSPVMTNDRVSPPVLILGQNAAIMAPPSAAPYPADHPAALPVSMSASLPMHPDHLSHSAPNAKTREAQGPAGFGPGGFLPLTFLLCHKQKNKSRTF